MTLDALQKEILDDAKRKSGEIESAAKNEAESILRQARDMAKSIDETAERELREETARIALEHKSDREMQEKGITFAAKEQYVAGLMERLRATVARRIKEKGYKRIFDSALKEAEKISPAEDLTIVIDKQDEKFVKGFAGKKRYQKIDGLIIYAAGGKIKMDATIDSLFDKNRDMVREELMRGVFGEGKKPVTNVPAKRSAAKKAARRAPKQKRAKHRK
ncbi:V-type proton ATPase subunit E [uncultured archaeon]|nr:V-type proton ATPase subunit E [uncultured archaeon]